MTNPLIEDTKTAEDEVIVGETEGVAENDTEETPVPEDQGIPYFLLSTQDQYDIIVTRAKENEACLFNEELTLIELEGVVHEGTSEAIQQTINKLQMFAKRRENLMTYQNKLVEKFNGENATPVEDN